jgi:hypothetical protein
VEIHVELDAEVSSSVAVPMADGSRDAQPKKNMPTNQWNDTGLTGTVSAVYAPGMTLSRAGVVAGQDMTSEAALTKLAYLLAVPGSSAESVARDMSVSLRGELTMQSGTAFQHPGGAISSQARILTALGYAIASGDLGKVQQITNGEHEWVLNDADYSGNTPVVRFNCHFIVILVFFSFF